MSKTNKRSLKSAASTFFKVMKYLKRYRFHFILSLIFTAVSVGLTLYVPEWPEENRELIIAAGHGGGDFIVIREIFRAIRENKKPEFDEYFATTLASVAILGHRSLLEGGTAYDIPDFHNEEDRVKFENDTLSPFYHSDGRTPSIRPSNSTVNFTPEDMARYDAAVAEIE